MIQLCHSGNEYLMDTNHDHTQNIEHLTIYIIFFIMYFTSLNALDMNVGIVHWVKIRVIFSGDSTSP